MFTLLWTRRAREQYDALRQAALRPRAGPLAAPFKQVHKCLALLGANPRHAGLHRHKYASLLDPAGLGREVFEVYAQDQTPGVCRILWCYGPRRGEIAILAIAPYP